MGEQSIEGDLAIRRTLSLYCHRCDDGDFAAVAELFAPDGSFAHRREVVSGRAAIAAWFAVAQTPERRGLPLRARRRA